MHCSTISDKTAEAPVEKYIAFSFSTRKSITPAQAMRGREHHSSTSPETETCWNPGVARMISALAVFARRARPVKTRAELAQCGLPGFPSLPHESLWSSVLRPNTIVAQKVITFTSANAPIFFEFEGQLSTDRGSGRWSSAAEYTTLHAQGISSSSAMAPNTGRLTHSSVKFATLSVEIGTLQVDSIQLM